MDVHEVSLRAFLRTAMDPKKFTDKAGEPVDRYVRLHSGHTHTVSRKFAGSIPVQINGDPEELADLLIARAASERVLANCFVMLFEKGENNYKDHANLPKTHKDTEAGADGQGFLTIQGKDGPIAVIDRDPVAQAVTASALAVGVSLRVVEGTNTTLLCEISDMRRENRVLTRENAQLRAVVFVLERFVPHESDPGLKMFEKALADLREPMMEGMGLISLLVQHKQGVPNPGTVKERARRGTPDPPPPSDTKTKTKTNGEGHSKTSTDDSDTMDAEFEEAPATDEEYGVELDKQMGYVIDMCMARAHLVTPARAMRLIPVLQAAKLPVSMFCEVCQAEPDPVKQDP